MSNKQDTTGSNKSNKLQEDSTQQSPKAQVTPSQESLQSLQQSIASLSPATSAMNQKSATGQTALSQYQYVPHRPPVLPGPSVLAEASQNELYRETSKYWRSLSQVENIQKSQESLVVQSKKKENKPRPKKIVRPTSPTNHPAQATAPTKKTDSKNKNRTVNICLVDFNMSKAFRGKEGKQRANDGNPQFLRKNFLQREKSTLPVFTQSSYVGAKDSCIDTSGQVVLEDEEPEKESKKTCVRGVQCTIFGNSEKIFVISPIINSLLRGLAFLLYELNREEADICGKGETKALMSQIQLLLGDLLNHKIEKDFIFDATYSDSKRYEKIFEELQKYLKDVYGSNEEYKDKTEEMKKIFVEFKKKEMEFAILSEKMKKKEEDVIPELIIKEKDLKQPELVLQNKRLEREQLLADVEFSKRDLKYFQKTLAELDWEIKISQEQTTALKKSLASKSKTEIVGKKSPSHKLSNEGRRSKSRDSEDNIKKKT